MPHFVKTFVGCESKRLCSEKWTDCGREVQTETNSSSATPNTFCKLFNSLKSYVSVSFGARKVCGKLLKNWLKSA